MLLCYSFAIVSNSLRPHGLQHTRLLCPSLPPRVFSLTYSHKSLEDLLKKAVSSGLEWGLSLCISYELSVMLMLLISDHNILINKDIGHKHKVTCPLPLLIILHPINQKTLLNILVSVLISLLDNNKKKKKNSQLISICKLCLS